MAQRQGIFFVDLPPRASNTRQKKARIRPTLASDQTVFTAESIFGFGKPKKAKQKTPKYEAKETPIKHEKGPAVIKTQPLVFKKIKLSKIQRLKGKPPSEAQKNEFKRLKKAHNIQTLSEEEQLSKRYNKQLKGNKTKRSRLNELTERGMVNKLERRSADDFTDAADIERTNKYLKKQSTKSHKNDKVKKLKSAFISALPVPPEKGTLSSAIKRAITRMSKEDFYDFLMSNASSVSEFWALYHALTADRPDGRLTRHERGIRRRLHYKSEDEINSVLQDLAYTLEDYGLSKKWTR